MTIEISAIAKKYSLTYDQARDGLLKYGENILIKNKHTHPIIKFLKKFTSPLLIIIIIAAVISFFIDNKINAIILLAMVFLSAILDFVNSYKSEKAVESLTAKVVSTAKVVRGDAIEELPFKLIVPGDIILLSAGDVVPADAQVLEANDFFVNQSSLTGESYPVEKQGRSEIISSSEIKTDHPNFVFMGTSVITGYATVLVVKTGSETQFGKIGQSLNKAKPMTDFELNIKKFSYFIMYITLVLVVAVFAINAFMGKGVFTSFVFSLAIAIGLTPELLPVIITVSLSHGSIRMGKKDVIVKNLSSIQNYGNMNVLCTDKTGTLTQDKISVVSYVDGQGQSSEEVLLFAYLGSFFHTGVQNPLDAAVKNYKKVEISDYQKLDEIPFDFERRRQSVVVEKNVTDRWLITKGAPEEVFKVTKYYWQNKQRIEITETLKQQINDQFAKLSNDGYRVLAVAIKDLPDRQEVYDKSFETELCLVGFIAFLDPPKDTAKDAIDDLESLGVELKVLTGDNEVLTQKICQSIGLPNKGVITGDALGKLSEQEFKINVLQNTIFARVSPEQKEKIILVLKEAGKTVGYMGDGINDAPALRAADVGISVNNAVDIAKETADIILLRKSLRVLRDGVIEGRKTFENSLKYIMMGLSSNFGNMVSMMGASLFLPFLPMLPTQVLFNNFLYDMSQLTIPTDNVDEEAIKQPTKWDLKFIRKYMFTFGPISSIFDFATFFLLYFGLHLTEKQFQTGWFMESLATQVLVIYLIRTKKIPFFKSLPSLALMLNTMAAVLIAWIVPYTPLGGYLQFSGLSWGIVGLIAGVVVVYLFLVEITKYFFYRKTIAN